MKILLFLTILLQPPLQVAGDLQAVLVDQAAAALASVTHAAVVFVLYQFGALGVTILTAQSLPPFGVSDDLFSSPVRCDIDAQGRN